MYITDLYLNGPKRFAYDSTFVNENISTQQSRNLFSNQKKAMHIKLSYLEERKKKIKIKLRYLETKTLSFMCGMVRLFVYARYTLYNKALVILP